MGRFGTEELKQIHHLARLESRPRDLLLLAIYRTIYPRLRDSFSQLSNFAAAE